MTLDRAELAGTGAAIVFHVALIAALSIGLARVTRAPEPPAMEVDLVQDVSLQPAAPTPMPSVSEAPEFGPAPTVEPNPAPVVEAAPPKPIVPTPQVDAAERREQRIKTAREAAARAAVPKPAPRVSRLGSDFLKGIAEAKSSSPAKAAAPTVSASAMAGIVQAIRRQVQPCADRQINPGPGASKIQVRLHLRLSRSGRLMGPPEVAGVSGVDDSNARYVDRVREMAIATFVGCAPLTGLPSELYETADGRGWSDFILRYNLP